MSAGNSTSPGGADGSQLRSTRIFLRPIANPFALGFTGLAVATLLLSGLELGWISGTARVQTAVLIIAFAPTIQLEPRLAEQVQEVAAEAGVRSQL